jgi:penicillin-binding protein 1C
MSSPKRLACVAFAVLACASAAAAVPSPEQVRNAWRPSDAVLLDRHGVELQSLRIDMTARRLAWVPLDEISPALTRMVLQAEDQRFYEHGGVDLRAIGKAAWDNLFRTRARGASTVTMQLAGLLDPALQSGASGRSWSQKWDQMAAARELEARWSKPQILEAYLNLLTFRGEVQGIAAASQSFFAKAPSGLDDAEAAILASLIRGPNASPATVARRACALAKENSLSVSCDSIRAMALVALAHPQGRAGASLAPQAARKLLQIPAGRVASTIDADVQRFVQESLRQQLMALKPRNVNDAAAVVLDNRTGEILAYVGNAGDSDVDGVMALRQAGSTLKPFLYELAIEKRLLTAASILDDSPIDISTPAGLYIPQNYDKDFKGYVSVRTSLASSLNVPAVRTLVMTGMDPFYNRLKDLGLDSLTEGADYYGYSLALGSAEVNLLSLTNAYRALANGGVTGPARLLEQPAAAQRRVMDPAAVFVIGDILSDRAARNVTFGLANELATQYWSAVKTGTSKDMRDNWCIGFSQDYTVGVWVGNFDGEPMWDVSGVTGAAPVWRDVMDWLHKDAPRRRPSAPAGVLSLRIAYEPALEPERSEWFVAGTESSKIELVAEPKRVPKIRYPGNGSIIAIDPDIPPGRQRVFLQAQAARALSWRLDGVVVAPASGEFAWPPVAGMHRLELSDDAGRTVDAIGFEVRGEPASR